MNQELQAYYNNTQMPWSKLFYRVVEQQLNNIENMCVLDFGSGFGYLADSLAKNNKVTAIEPNAEMVEIRSCKNKYRQIIGSLDELRKIESESFDVITCHNVLEYVPERIETVLEFSRLLKKDGILSIVKHNHAGRVMQKVVFENNIDDAISILNGGESIAQNFGKINYYDNNNIEKWSQGLRTEKILGIRIFWALQQNNELKKDVNWQDKMFEVEMKVCNKEEFLRIAFYNHVLLVKHD